MRVMLKPPPAFSTALGLGFLAASLVTMHSTAHAQQSADCDRACPRSQRDEHGCCPAPTGSGSLYVTTGTTRAQVLIDGREVGTTPLRVSVAAGQHAVEIHVNGSAGPPRTITIRAGQLTTLRADASGVPESDRPRTPSITERFAQLEDRCDDGDGSACADAAALVRRGGPGLAANATRATELLRRGCDHGNAGACHLLGDAHRTGTGTARDPAEAARIQSQGCSGGSMQACAALARSYERGQGVRLDRVRALELYRQACEGGYQNACGDRDRLSR